MPNATETTNSKGLVEHQVSTHRKEKACTVRLFDKEWYGSGWGFMVRILFLLQYMWTPTYALRPPYNIEFKCTAHWLDKGIKVMYPCG